MFHCRLCHNEQSQKLFSIDNTIIDWLYSDAPNVSSVPRYPFSIHRCDSCWLIQLKDIVSMDEVYDNYTFFLTNIDSINDWVKNLANILQQEYGISGKDIFEAGASDGYFLSLFKDKNTISGIEPSESLVLRAKDAYGIDIQNGYFGKEYAKKHDFVICRHVLEHIPDVESFIDALVSATKENGKLYIEVPNADDIFSTNNYSNFFHEHVNYFSPQVLRNALQSRGFEEIFFSKNTVHAGSFGILFQRKVEEIDYTVLQQKMFSDVNSLDFLRTPWLKVHGYGAANKTFKLLSILQLENVVSKIYDRNQNLWGKYIPLGSGIQIESPENLVKESPDYIVLFATSYASAITTYLRASWYTGKIVLLYPEVQVI